MAYNLGGKRKKRNQILLYTSLSRILTLVDTYMVGYLYRVRSRILTLVDTNMVGYLYRVRSRILTLVDSNVVWSYSGLLGRTKKFQI